MKKHYILAGLLMLAAAPGFAQVKIGAAGAPDASATLEVTGGAANNKGLLLPRLTTVQRNAIANPAKGLLIFNTTTNEVQTNIGTPAAPSWSTTPAAGWNLAGNAGTNPANNFIGTTDNQPLVLRTNNAEAARVLANGWVGIGVAAPETKLHLNNGSLRITSGSTPLPNHALHIINDGGGSSNNDNIVIESYGAITRPSIAFKSNHGTFAAPENSQAGDNVGNVFFTARRNGAEANVGIISGDYLGDGTSAASRLTFVTSQQTVMTLDSSANVGIGSVSPRAKLQVEGGVLVRNEKNVSHSNGTLFTWSTLRGGNGEAEFVNYHGLGTGGFRFYDLAPGTAAFNTNNIAFIAPITGAYTNVSDMRVKTNVNIINDGLQKVMAMRPVSYDFHSGRTIKDGVVKFTENDKVVKTIGFLAQELAKVVPEAVVIPKDPANELYNVSYATVVPVLTKAIQEQQAEIEQLKAALSVSKADNAALKADVSKISALAERMQRLEASLNTSTADNTAVSK
ncbi:Chaperone of endosialidase [Dyadobacter sp. SG02]|uniref:tail fiber domain-containing protein n=1 Tax=Dyadobacter sp. SG02 TaxID=1855291 RepID=UPI0008C59376|nr:tail fiber domain-containing protein [Dyadobacter sp. SG02]SEJ59667.1 Chaperone of endosialidase [Dyadobacter sp. SG02]